MKRHLQIFGGVVAVLVGLGFIMPAVAQVRTQGALPTVGVVLLLLGVFLSLGGVIALPQAFAALSSPVNRVAPISPRALR